MEKNLYRVLAQITICSPTSINGKGSSLRIKLSKLLMSMSPFKRHSYYKKGVNEIKERIYNKILIG